MGEETLGCVPPHQICWGGGGIERGRRDEDQVMLGVGGKGKDNFWCGVGAPAEVAAREREGRETPKSEKEERNQRERQNEEGYADEEGRGGQRG